MIAFGCSVTDPEPYRRYAEPGIRVAAEPDSRIYPLAAVGTIGRSYNLLLDSAAACEDLEALVLVHPHTQIDDPLFTRKVRAALRDPEVAVLGSAGATGVKSIAWWEGRVSRGQVIQRYPDNGGGELPEWGWANPDPAPSEVDAVDGFLLVLSPWAVRHVRFDEGLMFGHGFDLDYCLQVRAAGRKVMTFDVRVIEHRSLDFISDLDLWVESHIVIARKWEDRMPGAAGPPADAKQRARRAEAEREAARAVAYSRKLEFDARVQRLQRRIDEATQTRSWRLTRPLRDVNKWRRERAQGPAAPPR